MCIHLSVKIMERITQNVLTEQMLPIARMNGEDFEKMKVSVDGYNAEIFISENYGSDKIVILFNELHPHWGEVFTTKYFFFETPGKMSWGHNGEVMKILVI
jgi:hypothetical protein